MKTVVEHQTTEEDAPDLRRRKLLLPLSAAVRDAAPASEVTALSSEPPALPPHLALAEAIRQCSAGGNLMDQQAMLAHGFASQEDAEPEQETLETLLAHMQADEACQDIQHIIQQENRFYYSERHMSHNYARILVFTHEQDACATLAQSVRFECETYPRPFKVDMLALPPYGFDADMIASTLRFLSHHEAYGDIHQVEASNGAVYLYSDLSMSVGKAQGLCEWIEVEQYENP